MTDTIDTTSPLFGLPAFRLLFSTKLMSNVANQMLGVAVGWQIYALTDSALNLGLIGLVQFLPPVTLTLFAGQAADRYDRRRILCVCYTLEFIAVAGLLLATLLFSRPVSLMYLLLLLNGIGRAFESPSMQSLLPAMIPRSLFSRAVAASSSATQMAMIGGPAIGGLLYGLGPEVVYGVASLLLLGACGTIVFLGRPPMPAQRPKVTWASVFGGLRFIWRRQIVLGAISLDLFAVLFGGATALLPIFARDALQLGPVGLGILRSAPAVGALIVAIALSRYPIKHRAGAVLLWAVAVFGAATIVFGLSGDFFVSLLALIVIGGSDMFSVAIRETLVQVATPEDMRGRVAAVSALFVGTSNQLGAFESGVTADWFGAVGSVLLGGCATILVVLLWAGCFPRLRRVDRMETVAPE
jgi:MFS family permease